MMRRGGLVLAWLFAGHAVAAACYATLIRLSDANAFLLGLSALSVLGGVVAWALTDATALAWLLPGTSFREAWRLALRRGIAAFLLAALVFVVIWWLTERAHDWYRAHATQVDAWLIATFDTARTSWVNRVVSAFRFAVPSIVGLSLSASLMATVVIRGMRAAFAGRWVVEALSRFQLGLVAGVMVLLVAAPWRVVSWRPAWLPPTWLETAFVAGKLAVLLLLVHIAWGLVLFAASRPARTPH